MQNRLRDYKDPLGAFEHNLMNLGLHNPGRYAGFDTFVPVSALGFSMAHIASGISYKQTNDIIKGPCGIILTPQGCIIMEDEPINGLALDTNVGNTKMRYDLLVITHNFSNVNGGSAATYSILKGPINNPIKPILSDTLKQVPIGVFQLAPGASDLTQITYSKFKCPDSGDGEDARLSSPNIFKAIQVQSSPAAAQIAPAETFSIPVTSHLWSFEPDGNTLQILPPTGVNDPTYFLDGLKIADLPLQTGTLIKVQINEKIIVRDQYAGQVLPTPFQQNGYRALSINSSFYDTIATAYSSFKPSAGETYILSFVFLNGFWFLEAIGGKTNTTKFAPGDIIEWHGNIAANFDATGKGLTTGPKAGWAICNGLNNTPDRRGYIPFGATNVPAAGAPAVDGALFDLINYQAPGGSKETTLIVDNLPAYNLSVLVSEPGHRHFLTGDNSGQPITNTAGISEGNLDGGNAGYVLKRSNIEPNKGRSSLEYTGIGVTVDSGGNDTPISKLPNVYATVWIMKL